MKIKIIANITLKCIKYLQKHRIEVLQDEEGNLIYISKNKSNEMIKSWQNRPLEIKINDKEGIYYKGKNYIMWR